MSELIFIFTNPRSASVMVLDRMYYGIVNLAVLVKM